MPFLIALAGAAVAFYLLVIRARNAAEITHELLNVADDVKAAARRLGFRQLKAEHPVESIEDPNVAAATLAVAFMELDDLPTEAQRGALVRALQSECEVDLKEAEELVVLGRWLMGECQGPAPAISRAARKLYKLTGGKVGPLFTILNAVSGGEPTDKQRDALGDIKTAFRIRA